MGELILCVLLLVVCLTTAAAESLCALPSCVQLSVGSNFSMQFSYSDFPVGYYVNGPAIPTVDVGGVFFPILSSPSFEPSFDLPPKAFGFSLGFYFSPISYGADSAPCAVAGCNIYLALCAGSSGGNPRLISDIRLGGAQLALNLSIYVRKRGDGLAAPVWIANLDSPIHYADKVSLMVVADSRGSTTLQLRDGENPVWQVRNAGAMEIQETGDLLIYSSPSRTHPPVWQSSRTDTLIDGRQNLTLGKELVSNDSSYVARMENGGLVFYMNKTRFNRELYPPPYWLFPVFRDDPKSLHFNTNQLISSAPCSNSPAYTHVVRGQMYGNGLVNYSIIALYPGSCVSGESIIQFIDEVELNLSWQFLRLENDGRIYSYAVYKPNGEGFPVSVTRTAVDMEEPRYFESIPEPSFTPPFLEWHECNAPMACGPLGVCTPGARTACTCLDSTFEPIKPNDLSQGCKRRTNLSMCSSGNGHTGSSDFVQLNSTASILLFNGWIFNSTHAQVDACKQLCLSDCSCNGFVYQNDTSVCFFIYDEISLLTVTDKTLNFGNYTSEYSQESIVPHNISAKNYVTHLKVASGKRTSRSVLMIALIAIIPSAMVCLVLGMIIYLFRARQKKNVYNSMVAKEEKELKDILPLLPSRFSYKELYEATKGFSKLLGTGGCGSVYAGVLSDGRKVAVKVLQVVLQGAGQSKQFLAEVATVGRTGHHNIVRLVGFCWEVSQRILVYEYVERGSLDRWIFVNKSMGLVDEISAVTEPLLDWKTRYNVAIGIARGLSYLHEDCEQPILHFDIKPQNILLGDDFVAKLADFGMSRLMQRDMTSVMTGVRGTPGYIAPEWYSQGTVSKKSDVYSMGMVFLELVGGRKNLDFSLLNSSLDPVEQEAWHFPSWAAKKCKQGLMMELVDKRLHVCGFDAEQAHRLIHIAFWCVDDDPAMRPNAPTVVQWLEGSSPIEQPPFSIVLNAAGRRPNTKAPISFS